jgi:uncharacterized protein
MEVRLDRIAEERFEWSESLSVPVEELEETDLVALGDVQLSGRIERTSHSSFLLTANLEYHQTLACVRCLREIDDPVSAEVNLLISVGKAAAASAKASAGAPAKDRGKDRAKAREARAGRAEGEGEEQELLEEDLGVVALAEPLLDTRPVAVEQIHLGIPMKPLCKEDCQGLCGQCGADLNEGPCSCTPAGDTRLAKLAALRGKLEAGQS